MIEETDSSRRRPVHPDAAAQTPALRYLGEPGSSDAAMQAMSEQAGSETFQRIVDAKRAVVVLETGHAEEMIVQFRRLAQRSGQVMYLWRESDGLHSLREGEVAVPGCVRVADTLRYVMQSMHFGVYLLADMAPPVKPTVMSLLRQIARVQTPYVRRVVLMTQTPALASVLEDVAVSIDCDHARAVRPRLRDGRWVV